MTMRAEKKIKEREKEGEKKNILHEERSGHRVSRGVGMIKECIEEREKRVSKVQCTPHGSLGHLPKYIGLLRLKDTDT